LIATSGAVEEPTEVLLVRPPMVLAKLLMESSESSIIKPILVAAEEAHSIYVTAMDLSVPPRMAV
jgi:hypothetical protein